MSERNSGVPADQRIDFRIGINVGDIIIENDDIFGHGVNVAARLQELAEPGGICVSGRVHEGVTGDDPDVLGNAAFVLAYFGEDIDATIELVDRALALNPGFARGWRDSGYVRLYAGQPELAIEHFETYVRLNPHADRASPYLGIGMAHFFARRFEDAKAMLLRSVQERPAYPTTHRFLASCYAQMGRLDEAREAVRRLRACATAVMPSSAQFRNPEHEELFLSGLRLAADQTE